MIDYIFMGIDPGKKGGYAYIRGDIIKTFPWDDKEFIYLCTCFRDTVEISRTMVRAPIKLVCCLEKVGAMPGQGVTSMFNFGKSAGFIEGVLQACSIPYQLITPQKWKKEFMLNSSKQKSCEVCRKLFPDVDLKRTPRCHIDDDGMAEALLMAEYARRNL